MRISQKNIAMVQTELSQNVNEIKNLKAGEVFNAKVIAIQTEALLLKFSDGSSLHAKINSPERFVEGENLEFKVLESDGNEVKIEVSKNVKIPIDIKKLFTSAKIEVTKENIKAFEVLKSLNVEITKENIVKLVDNFKYLNKITKVFVEQDNNIIKNEIEKVSKSPEEFLKAILDSSKTTDANKVVATKSENNFMSIIKNLENFEKVDIKELAIKLLDLPEIEKENVNVVKKENIPEKMSETIKNILGVINTKDGLDIDSTITKLGVLLKTDKSFSINNLSVLDKLIFSEEDISKQIESVEKNLPKGIDNKVLSLLKGFNIENFKTEEGLKNYFNKLHSSLLELSESKSLNEGVKTEIKTLIKSIEFIENDSKDITWIQVPLNINEKQKNLDVLIKNEGKYSKKINKDNTKILIALNTEYLDLVQALIHIDKKNLNISFKVENKNVEKVINKYVNELEGLLIEDGYSVKISTAVKNNVSFSEFIKDDNSLGHINIKV